MKKIFLALLVLVSPSSIDAKECGPFRTITAREGDTVSKLAELLEVREERFYSLNPELKKRFLIAGERICFPLPSDRWIKEVAKKVATNDKLMISIEQRDNYIRQLREEIESLHFWGKGLILTSIPTLVWVSRRLWEIKRRRTKKSPSYILPKL